MLHMQLEDIQVTINLSHLTRQIANIHVLLYSHSADAIYSYSRSIDKHLTHLPFRQLLHAHRQTAIQTSAVSSFVLHKLFVFTYLLNQIYLYSRSDCIFLIECRAFEGSSRKCVVPMHVDLHLSVYRVHRVFLISTLHVDH